MLSKRLKALLLSAGFSLLFGCQTLPEVEPLTQDITTEQSADQSLSQTEPQTLTTSPADDLYQSALKSARDGKTDAAITQFQQLIQLDSVYSHAHTNLGLLLLQQDKSDNAHKALLTAIDQDKNDAIAYNHLAIIERQQGNFKQSRLYYLEAIEADPDYAIAYLNLGILMDLYLQDLKAALKQYKTYQKLTNDSDETVEKWLVDIQRRIDAGNKKSEG